MTNKRFLSKKGTYIGLLLTIAIVMVLVATMMWQGAATTAFAQIQDSISQDSSGQADSIKQCTVSIDDNFTDDTILVALSQKASLNFKQYKVSDFPEVNLASVIEITEYVAIIDAQVFDGLIGVTIRTSYQSKPEGWQDGWNGNCPVEWGVEI